MQPLWEVGELPKRLHSKWSPVGWVSPQLVESRQSFRACECQPSVDVEFQYFFKSPLAALWQLYACFRVQAHDIGFSEALPNLKPISSAEGKEVTSESPWLPRRRLVPSLLVTGQNLYRFIHLAQYSQVKVPPWSPVICDNMVLCHRASVQRIFRRE